MGSLLSAIKKRKLVKPWSVRYQMMLDICEGREFLHSGKDKSEAFYQDVKSASILLTMEGKRIRGKIADFGLARKFSFLLTL